MCGGAPLGMREVMQVKMEGLWSRQLLWRQREARFCMHAEGNPLEFGDGVITRVIPRSVPLEVSHWSFEF